MIILLVPPSIICTMDVQGSEEVISLFGLIPSTAPNLGIFQFINFYLPIFLNLENFRSLRSELAEIDENLKSIQPPTALARKARSLDDRKFWKASEFRSWVLYYSVPLLFGRMKEPYFTHWCCFVLGLYILLQPSISKENLRLAEILFRFFYQQHSNLYGIFFLLFIYLFFKKMTIPYFIKT